MTDEINVDCDLGGVPKVGVELQEIRSTQRRRRGNRTAVCPDCKVYWTPQARAKSDLKLEVALDGDPANPTKIVYCDPV